MSGPLPTAADFAAADRWLEAWDVLSPQSCRDDLARAFAAHAALVLGEVAPPRWTAIRDWVAAQTGLAASRITGEGREAPVVRARDALVWGGRELCGLTGGQIGRLLDRDPSTISVAIARASWRRQRDPAFRRLTDALVLFFAVAS